MSDLKIKDVVCPRCQRDYGQSVLELLQINKNGHCQICRAELSGKYAGLPAKPFFKAQLPMPPSVNDYWHKAVRYKNGRPYVHIYLSARAKKFRSDVIAHVASLGRIRTHSGRIKAVVTLHGRTKADYDIDNYSKGLFDALTHALVYKDDSLIHATEFEKGEVIKGGRVEVELYELNT